MDLKTIKKTVLDIEWRLDAANLYYHDFNAWPLLRLMLARRLMATTDSLNTGVRAKKKEQAQQLAHLLLPLLSGKPRLNNCDLLLFVQKHYMTTDNNGTSVHKFADPIRHFLGDHFRIHTLHYNLDVFAHSPSLSKDRLPGITNDFDPWVAWARLRSLLKTKLIRQKPIRGIERFLPLFKEYQLDYNLFVKRLAFIDEMAVTFERLLKKGKPKLVGLVCFYGPVNMALSLACHRLGIPCIDIQHGIQNDQHLFYTGWENLPATGHQLIPSLFWTWGETNRKRIKAWTDQTTAHDAFTGGNLWIAWQKDTVTSTSISLPDNGKTSLLISLQGNTVAPEFLLDYLETVTNDFNLIFRDHPRYKVTGELRDRINKLSVIPLEVASEWPLYPLLERIDIHLTGFSTVAFEAYMFGKRTIFFDINALNGFDKLIQTNPYFTYASDATELSTALKESDLPEEQEAIIEINPKVAKHQLQVLLGEQQTE